MGKNKKNSKTNMFGGHDDLDPVMKMALMMSNANSAFNFIHSLLTHPTVKPDENNLGKGMRLVPDETIENNLNYSHLYKDGIKVSDMLFRRGGMCSGYANGDYCDLIAYPNYPADTMGIHAIVDLNGKIALMAESTLDYPHYYKGVIAGVNNKYYNLLTGQVIVEGSNTLKTENFLFVDAWSYNTQYKKGVHKITFATGEVEIFN